MTHLLDGLEGRHGSIGIAEAHGPLRQLERLLDLILALFLSLEVLPRRSSVAAKQEKVSVLNEGGR